MFKKLGKALTGLVLTKEAQDALEQHAARQNRQQVRRAETAREQALAQMQAQARDLITEDRAELIRKAMQVRKAKQTILADLNDEDRAKLVALAMKALLNEGKTKE